MTVIRYDSVTLSLGKAREENIYISMEITVSNEPMCLVDALHISKVWGQKSSEVYGFEFPYHDR